MITDYADLNYTLCELVCVGDPVIVEYKSESYIIKLLYIQYNLCIQPRYEWKVYGSGRRWLQKC